MTEDLDAIRENFGTTLSHRQDLPSAGCTCCPVHEERNRRMEQRVYEMHAILTDLGTKIGPALTAISAPGGIASIFNPFKRRGY